MGIDEVVSTCEIQPPRFSEDLSFRLLRYVNIVILSPSFGFDIISIGVVVPAVSSPLMDQDGVKMVRGTPH